MNDLFSKVGLAEFMREEARSITTADTGMQVIAVQIGMMLKQFSTEYVLKAGLMSSFNPARPDEGDAAKGRETLLRAYALLTVSAALGMRDVSERMKLPDEFPEIDLLVQWYRNRWPR